MALSFPRKIVPTSMSHFAEFCGLPWPYICQ